jgi:signal transduction histidine kinase
MRISDEYSQNDMPYLLSRLKAIATTVMYAAGADTLGGVLERLADSARDLVGARYAALGIPDGRGGLEYFEFTGMSPEQANMIGHLPRGRGLLGAIMQEREPIRLERMQDDPRSSGFPPHHPSMERFLGVPILVGDHLFGMLYLTDRLDGKPFTEQDQWLIETTAGYAALAIAGVELREQQRRVALLEERDRISMELHDGVIQSLYAVGMYLELIRTSEALKAEDLTEAIHNLDSVITDIRGYIQNLKARERQERTLEQSLREVVKRLHVPPTLNVVIEPFHEQVALRPTIFEAVLQMANEALSNVIRHAHAQHVHITAMQDARAFHMTISDDGRGFDPNQIVSDEGGLGLRNMQQRARLHGGEVTIESAPESGTRVHLVIPI